MFCCLKMRWENRITFYEERPSWHRGSILSNKQKAQQAITDYRQALQKAETDTGVRVENQAITDKLSTMEQELHEAFSGPAPQQEEKRNRAAKTRHGESLKSQRSQ